MATLQKVFLSRSGRLLGLSVGLDGRIALCRHVASCNHAHRYRPESCRRLCTPAVDLGSERMMQFEEYRKLRKALKWRARIAGIPMGLLGIAASSFVNVRFNPRMFEMSPEEIKPILGMDPIVFAALCGVGTGIVAYMIGGALFKVTWQLLASKKARQIQKREEDFLQRLQKHRFSAFNRYEDDYYGDKINTLSDYRQWIRVQQKKRNAAAKFAQERENEGIQTADIKDKS